MNLPLSRWSVWGLLSLLTAAAFLVRLLWLGECDGPCGTDGYYYVVQVEDLVQKGSFHVADSSWVLYFLAGLHHLGVDSILAIQLGAAFLAALVVPTAFVLGTTLDERNCAIGWGLALWAAASPTLTHLAADFSKNLGIIPLALLALVGALVLQKRPVFGGLLLVTAALATATGHRLGAALLLLALVGVFASWLWRRTVGRWLILAAAITIVFGLLSAFLPGLLQPVDLERLSGQLSLIPSAPWGYFELRTTHMVQKVELLLPWLALAAGAWGWVRWPHRRLLLGGLLLPLLACELPFWRHDLLDLGYRLALMGPTVAAPILAVVIVELPLSKVRGNHQAALLASAALVGSSIFGFDQSLNPPYERYERIIDTIPRPLPKLVIAHQGLNFLYDHVTGKEAMAWAPERELNREEVWRLAWGVRRGEWMMLNARPKPLPLEAEYWWVREDVWEQLVAQADDELKEIIADWRNPTEIRPPSIRRR